MGFHHVALATPDIAATHHFYTVAMGFELVKAEIAPTPQGGWAKHVFYETGGNGMIAFWDLHGDAFRDVKGAISTDLGLPSWVNHIAFDAKDDAELNVALERWQSLGIDIIDIDHGFCRSVYTTDPNGILVEWCQDLRALTPEEKAHAEQMILASEPGEFDAAPKVDFIAGNDEIRPNWGVDLVAKA